MKLISYNSANVILSLPLDDVKPLGAYAPQAIIAAIRGRYRFAGGQTPFPTNVQLATPPNVPPHIAAAMAMAFRQQPNFKNGTATINDQAVAIQQLQIVPDLSTFVITTTTTDDGDLIADDILSLLETDFKFRDVKQRANKLYGGGLIVEFDRPLEDYVAPIKRMETLISSALNNSLGMDHKAHIEQITFGYDPSEIPQSKAVGNFTIQRRIGSPFSANRYFCGGPIRTQDLLKLLEDLERTIAA